MLKHYIISALLSSAMLPLTVTVSGAVRPPASVSSVAQYQTDSKRHEAELKRQQAEQQRLQAEQQRKLAEQQRLYAEEQRKEAEYQRKQAELQRKEAEKQRKWAEKQRKEAEKQRREAEKQRQKAERQLSGSGNNNNFVVVNGPNGSYIVTNSQTSTSTSDRRKQEKKAREARLKQEKKARETRIKMEKKARENQIKMEKEARETRIRMEKEARNERTAALEQARISRERAMREHSQALERARVEREKALEQARVARESALKAASEVRQATIQAVSEKSQRSNGSRAYSSRYVDEDYHSTAAQTAFDKPMNVVEPNHASFDKSDKSNTSSSDRTKNASKGGKKTRDIFYIYGEGDPYQSKYISDIHLSEKHPVDAVIRRFAYDDESSVINVYVASRKATKVKGVRLLDGSDIISPAGFKSTPVPAYKDNNDIIGLTLNFDSPVLKSGKCRLLIDFENDLTFEVPVRFDYTLPDLDRREYLDCDSHTTDSRKDKATDRNRTSTNRNASPTRDPMDF